ncbi:MAG: parallel beta-helix domain-containing protein [Myxococcota bacterium]
MRTLAILAFALGCTGETPQTPTEPTDAGPITCKDVERTNCFEIAAGDVKTLQDTVNLLEDDSAIVLEAGTYAFDNALTVRNANGVTIIGQGIDQTVLDFNAVQAQTNGVDVIADDIVLEGFTVVDAKKDGVRVEDSNGVVFRKVKVTWSGGPLTTNGAYGLYPVKVTNVLMEDSEAYNASDAGIYVGQCVNAIIRNNIAMGNVAGIEIENTQYADVYGNLAEDNTAGLIMFDLPGNPVIGRDVRIHDNRIINNNRENFAPGGTVSVIPAGTGTLALASRRSEIDNNTYENNQTTDVALLSGFVINGDPAAWHILNEDLVGDTDDLGLISDETGVFNYRSENIWVHDNTHSNSGGNPDDADFVAREIGFLLGVVYGEEPVDAVWYDAIGESSFSATDAAGNSNDNNMCIGVATGMTFASLNLEELIDTPSLENVYRPEPPFAPFDCEGTRPIAPEF